MSEFECVNGHIAGTVNGKCKICGSRIVSMDGMSRKELKRQEEYEKNYTQDEEDENNNKP